MGLTRREFIVSLLAGAVAAKVATEEVEPYYLVDETIEINPDEDMLRRLELRRAELAADPPIVMESVDLFVSDFGVHRVYGRHLHIHDAGKQIATLAKDMWDKGDVLDDLYFVGDRAVPIPEFAIKPPPLKS